MLGAYALSACYYDAYYRKPSRCGTLIRIDFARAFAAWTYLISPVAPIRLPPSANSSTTPCKMYLNDIYTASVNLAGTSGHIRALCSKPRRLARWRATIAPHPSKKLCCCDSPCPRTGSRSECNTGEIKL